jgi:hypothetical protein
LGIGNWELGIGHSWLSETGFLSISGFHQQSLRRNPVSVVVAKEKPGFYQSLVFTNSLSEETRFLWLSETGFLSISGFHQQSLSRNPVSLVVAKEKPGFYQSLVFPNSL